MWVSGHTITVMFQQATCLYLTSAAQAGRHALGTDHECISHESTLNPTWSRVSRIHLRLIKVFITRESNTICRWNSHQLTSLAGSLKVLEAHEDCTELHRPSYFKLICIPPLYYPIYHTHTHGSHMRQTTLQKGSVSGQGSACGSVFMWETHGPASLKV